MRASGFKTIFTSLAIGLQFYVGGNVFAQNASKGKFNVQNHYVDGEGYTFEYYAPYPGMTKVKLFDETGHLIWRGQYIDREGENKLRLRAAYLEEGSAYVFQFEYKLDLVRVPVSL